MDREFIKNMVRDTIRRQVQEMDGSNAASAPAKSELSEVFESEIKPLTHTEGKKVTKFIEEAIKSRPVISESAGAITTGGNTKTWTLDAGDSVYVISSSGGKSHGVKFDRNGGHEDFPVEDPISFVDDLIQGGAVLMRDKKQLRKKLGFGGFMRAIGRFIKSSALVGGGVVIVATAILATLSIIMPGELESFIGDMKQILNPPPRTSTSISVW